MAEHDQEKATNHDDFANEGESFEEAEEAASTGPRMSVKSIAAALREAERQFSDALMSSVPPEVTRHLVNSKKELLMAGQRLNEMAMEELDRRAARAEEIHAAKKR